MKQKKKGFTLIELMIVIAIIGILMAYAIPAYQAYVIRSKAGECLVLMNGAKVGVSERWSALNSLAAISSNGSALVASSISGANVDSVVITSPGVITCTYNNLDSNLAGESIVLTPMDNNGSLDWICTSSLGLDIKYRPGGC